jgi:hypothetical protein
MKYFLDKDINDVGFNYLEKHGTKFNNLDHDLVLMSNFYNQWGYLPNINEIIPISKHYEQWELIYDIVKEHIYPNSDYIYSLVNVFFHIEKNGIKLDKENFIRTYEKISNPHFSIKQGYIYTFYNLFTLTGRPSNSFNSINFAALDKDNGDRECFIPGNDYFIEVDFNGYHPRLLAELTEFSFSPSINVYEQIGKILNINDIQQVKKTTFHNMYGGIKTELLHKPFFKQIHTLTEKLWETIQKDGYIKTPSGRLLYLKHIDNPNSQKILNYCIQNFETHQNVMQLQKIIPNFNKLKSKIVLYTYDSILIDVDDNEINTINELIETFKYPVRIKTGFTYNSII